MTMAQIACEIAQGHGVTVADIKGRHHCKRLAPPRQEFMHRAHEAGYSWSMIGRFMSGRDHGTIIHGKRAHEARAHA